MSSLTREFEVYPSAARTTDPTATIYQFDGARAAHIVINCTAITASPSVEPRIRGVTDAGIVYDVLVATAIFDTGTTVLKIGPGIIGVAASSAADYLPRRWKLSMIHADTDSITYSVRAILFGSSNG